MSTVSELPDEDWSEEKILESLRSNASGSSVEGHERRRVLLDELRRRKTIKHIDAVVEILIDYEKKWGMSNPESSLIIELLSKATNLKESAFKKWFDDMVISKDDKSLYCNAVIIKNLKDKKKRSCIQPFLSLLMSCGSFTRTTRQMCQTFLNIDNRDIQNDIIGAALPYLRTADSFKVVYAVRIVTSLSSDFVPELDLVIERTLTGWFAAYEKEVLTDICSYYRRIQDERSIPHLQKIIKSDFDGEERLASKALASVIDSNPNTITEIWRFLEKEKKYYVSILIAFEEMETSIDVERLFSIVGIDLGKLLHFSLPRQTLKNIVIKSGKQAKPLLLKMVKRKDEVRHTFALECLEEIGVSIEEYSEVFEKPPILQVYEFFYEKRQEMLLENLWKEQDKLRNHIKKHQRFEYFIQNLFSALGFLTLFVDPSGKEGVDLVAFSPNEPYILVIGCTTSILKNDLEKLNMTLNEMKDALKELFARYRILPIVFTSIRVEVTPADSEYAGKNNIAILTQKEITTLLKMLRTNRRSREIIKHIEQSIPSVQTENPYEVRGPRT